MAGTHSPECNTYSVWYRVWSTIEQGGRVYVLSTATLRRYLPLRSGSDVIVPLHGSYTEQVR